MRLQLSPVLVGSLVTLAWSATARPVAAQAAAPHAHPSSASAPAPDDGAAVAAAIARVRAATSAFRALDSAVAAGYARDVATCVDNPPHGAMGFHHVNRALLDARLDPARPEILVYARTADGAYTLHGVEYVVPYGAHPREAAPPTIMGQQLRRADGLKLWYLHVWAWTANPQGMFADWNPAVRC